MALLIWYTYNNRLKLAGRVVKTEDARNFLKFLQANLQKRDL